MDPIRFRSAVLAKNACVVSDQPLASKIGYDILQKGGNAADAAIAMSISVGLLCLSDSGLGGDCHILYYKESDKSVHSINGSGRSAKDLNLQKMKDVGFSLDDGQSSFDLDENIKESKHGLFVTVPGYVMGIHQLFNKFGSKKLKMEDLLSPTIALAEKGVPVTKKIALKMQSAYHRVKNSKYAEDIFGKTGPKLGNIIRSPKLSKCLKEIATEGPKTFYCGKIAENIVKCVKEAGGVLTLDDMKNHFDNANVIDERERAIYRDFRGFRLWEMPPNTTGIIVLHTLSLLEKVNLKGLGHNTTEYIHTVSNAIREAILNCWDYICDPKYVAENFYNTILDGRQYKGNNQPSKSSAGKAIKISPPETLSSSSGDTSYVTAVDEEGNACSLIFSIYDKFGSGNMPDDCGFFLHSRGKLFSLDEKSPNVVGPRKRSLHTILPAMVTDPSSGELLASFGHIGGWMQPQGHIQVLLNMIIFGMDPQVALDQPRFMVGNTQLHTTFRDSLDILNLEFGIDSSTAHKLKNMGYNVIQVDGIQRFMFGFGQVIAKPKLWSKEFQGENENILWAGSDSRADGIPIAY